MQPERKPPPPPCEHGNVAARCTEGPCNGFLTEAECKAMSDEQAIRLAGGQGPSMIGRALYERAQVVQMTNPEGKLGPAFFADETELRATGKIPLDKHGRRLGSGTPSPAPASLSDEDENESPTDPGGDLPPLTDEEIAAELAKRVEAKRQRGIKMAPPVVEGETPPPPPVAKIAEDAEFDALTAVIDNPKSTPEQKAEAEERLAELTAPRFD